MCLIIVAQKGTEKKSEFLFEAIRKASITNKDGMGLAYKEGNNSTIFIDKGYKDVEEFIKKLESMEMSDEHGTLSIHLRIGNKGAVNESMTHPFICSSDEEEVVTLSGNTDKPVLMHNGTFIGLPLPAGKSDTFVFTQKFMSSKFINRMLVEDKPLFKEIFSAVLSVSRLCVIYPGDTETQLVGNWAEENGYYFSNETYKNSGIKDVGGKIINIQDTKGTKSFSGNARQSTKSTTKQLSLTGMSGVSNNSNGSTLVRAVRADYLATFIQTSNDKLVDISNYTYNVYKGLFAEEGAYYYSDESSLEQFVNRYNYKYVLLQAKETTDDSEHNLMANTYYRIETISHAKNNPEELYASICKVVTTSDDTKLTFIKLDELPYYFSIVPKQDQVSMQMFKNYLDAVALLKDHKKNITRYLRIIGNKTNEEIVTLTHKGNDYRFYAGVIRGFIYEVKKIHGLSVTKIKDLIKN